jgi:hypothetical protein
MRNTTSRSQPTSLSAKETSMPEFFQEGGPWMFPVLILGVLFVAGAARYAFDVEPVRLPFLGVLALTLLTFIATGLIADVANVFKYLADPGRVPDAMLPRIFAEGLKESSRPALLGLPLLGIGLTLVTIGLYRTLRRELSAARG